MQRRRPLRRNRYRDLQMIAEGDTCEVIFWHGEKESGLCVTPLGSRRIMIGSEAISYLREHEPDVPIPAFVRHLSPETTNQQPLL